MAFRHFSVFQAAGLLFMLVSEMNYRFAAIAAGMAKPHATTKST
jgi:hypothetical protein